MATSSIFTSVTIKGAKSCEKFAAALEASEKAKPRKVSFACPVKQAKGRKEIKSIAGRLKK